jgi:hypothetical protein
VIGLTQTKLSYFSEFLGFKLMPNMSYNTSHEADHSRLL